MGFMGKLSNIQKLSRFLKTLFTDISFLTNIISVTILILGYISPYFSKPLYNIGLFALSGSITNWLAVHMLFEKIPLIYGSGVVELRFQDFKLGIKDLAINQFFDKEGSSKFLTEVTKLSISKFKSSIDFKSLYRQLVETIVSSPVGGMVAMVGGEAALEPLRDPIINRIKNFLQELADSNLDIEKNDIDSFTLEAERVITTKIDKLTPIMVKEIVQDIIKKHLGWLVVWGGVFGGIIGLIATIIQ